MSSIIWSILAGIRSTDCKQVLEYVEAAPTHILPRTRARIQNLFYPLTRTYIIYNELTSYIWSICVDSRKELQQGVP